MDHTFDDYRKIFDGVIAKREGEQFLADLIQKKGRPAFPSASRNVAIIVNPGHDHIGQWSAGCQVIAGGWHGARYVEFFKYAKMATNFPVPYVLVKDTDVSELLGQ